MGVREDIENNNLTYGKISKEKLKQVIEDLTLLLNNTATDYKPQDTFGYNTKFNNKPFQGTPALNDAWDMEDGWEDRLKAALQLELEDGFYELRAGDIVLGTGKGGVIEAEIAYRKEAIKWLRNLKE